MAEALHGLHGRLPLAAAWEGPGTGAFAVALLLPRSTPPRMPAAAAVHVPACARGPKRSVSTCVPGTKGCCMHARPCCAAGDACCCCCCFGLLLLTSRSAAAGGACSCCSSSSSLCANSSSKAPEKPSSSSASEDMARMLLLLSCCSVSEGLLTEFTCAKNRC